MKHILVLVLVILVAPLYGWGSGTPDETDHETHLALKNLKDRRDDFYKLKAQAEKDEVKRRSQEDIYRQGRIKDQVRYENVRKEYVKNRPSEDAEDKKREAAFAEYEAKVKRFEKRAMEARKKYQKKEMTLAKALEGGAQINEDEELDLINTDEEEDDIR